MAAVTYRSMFWWVSGEVERLRIRRASYPDDEAVRIATERAEAVMKMVAWCEDHAGEIRAIAQRDKAKRAELSRRAAARTAATAAQEDPAVAEQAGRPDEHDE